MDAKPIGFVIVLLSVPVFIYSFAMGMTLVTRFVIDTFYGNPFLRSFGMGVVATDWLGESSLTLSRYLAFRCILTLYY